jgi:hypothetical protein
VRLFKTTRAPSTPILNPPDSKFKCAFCPIMVTEAEYMEHLSKCPGLLKFQHGAVFSSAGHSDVHACMAWLPSAVERRMASSETWASTRR